jgi:hypothetical protein
MSEALKVFSYAEARVLVPEVRRLTEAAYRTLAAAGFDPEQPDRDHPMTPSGVDPCSPS